MAPWAASTSTEPQSPPNDHVPNAIRDTCRPDRPNVVIFMVASVGNRCRDRHPSRHRPPESGADPERAGEHLVHVGVGVLRSAPRPGTLRRDRHRDVRVPGVVQSRTNCAVPPATGNGPSSTESPVPVSSSASVPSTVSPPHSWSPVTTSRRVRVRGDVAAGDGDAGVELLHRLQHPRAVVGVGELVDPLLLDEQEKAGLVAARRCRAPSASSSAGPRPGRRRRPGPRASAGTSPRWRTARRACRAGGLLELRGVGGRGGSRAGAPGRRDRPCPLLASSGSSGGVSAKVPGVPAGCHQSSPPPRMTSGLLSSQVLAGDLVLALAVGGPGEERGRAGVGDLRGRHQPGRLTASLACWPRVGSGFLLRSTDMAPL